jgi:KDO2-lipid IV(A) lauroyltransferase
MKRVRYFFEYIGLLVVLLVFKHMPLRMASHIGGFIGRHVGLHLAASRKAYRNLERALPGLPAHHKRQAIADMWDNLGRVIAEFGHIETIAEKHTKIKGIEHIQPFLKSGQQIMFIGAHLANWEVSPHAMLKQLGIVMNITYRAPNNPWVGEKLRKIRVSGGHIPAHAKSKQGGRDLIKAIKNGEHAAILIDQKYNEGIDVDFFGAPAPTNQAFVQLAQKYKMPVVPLHVQRQPDNSFVLFLDAPIPLFETDEATPRPITDVVKAAHILLENYIMQEPGQWLWLHRRWRNP